MEKITIEVNNLGKKYRNTLAVENMSFKIIKGQNKLNLYQFHTKVAKHYFCSNCGIYTHHNPRSNPAMTVFNLSCVDEIDTFKLKDIVVNDGQNHPLDKK